MELRKLRKRTVFIVGDRDRHAAAFVRRTHDLHDVRRLSALRTSHNERILKFHLRAVHRHHARRTRRDGQSQKRLCKVLEIDHRVIARTARRRIDIIDLFAFDFLNELFHDAGILRRKVRNDRRRLVELFPHQTVPVFHDHFSFVNLPIAARTSSSKRRMYPAAYSATSRSLSSMSGVRSIA